MGCGIQRAVSDPTIERIEAELRESRFTPWDVETFLANRHQAKIEALTAPQNPWLRRWVAAKDVAWNLAACVGTIAVIQGAGIWLVTGRLVIPPFYSG